MEGKFLLYMKNRNNFGVFVSFAVAGAMGYLSLGVAVFSTLSTRGRCHLESGLHTDPRLFLPVNGSGLLATTVESLVPKNTQSLILGLFVCF